MKIIVDAMGGDNAPEAIVRGGVLAANKFGEDIVLVGQEDRLRAVLKGDGTGNTPHLSIVHAPELVDMHDDPATVLRKSRNPRWQWR